MKNQTKIFYISGMAWSQRYGDYYTYDTTIMADSKEHALQLFNDTNKMARFFTSEPCVQTEAEWVSMIERMS